MSPKTPATPEVQTPEATGTKTIVFDRTHPSYAYWTGNRAELADEHADMLIAGGFAHLAADEATETPTGETR